MGYRLRRRNASSWIGRDGRVTADPLTAMGFLSPEEARSYRARELPDWLRFWVVEPFALHPISRWAA